MQRGIFSFVQPDFFITLALFKVLAFGSFEDADGSFPKIKYGAEICSHHLILITLRTGSGCTMASVLDQEMDSN